MSISRKTTNTPTPIFPKKHSYTFPKIEMKPNYTQAPKQQKISAKNLTTHQKSTPTKSHQTFHFLDSPLVFLHPCQAFRCSQVFHPIRLRQLGPRQMGHVPLLLHSAGSSHFGVPPVEHLGTPPQGNLGGWDPHNL